MVSRAIMTINGGTFYLKNLILPSNHTFSGERKDRDSEDKKKPTKTRAAGWQTAINYQTDTTNLLLIYFQDCLKKRRRGAAKAAAAKQQQQ